MGHRRESERPYSIVVAKGGNPAGADSAAGREHDVAKDKNKKKDKKKRSKDAAARGAKLGKRLKNIAENPLAAEIVAAALVATAAALKEPGKARQLAAQAGDELETLAKQGAERGNAMWQLALDIGRRSLESLTGEARRPKAKKTSTEAPRATAAPKRGKAAAPPATRRARTSPAK